MKDAVEIARRHIYTLHPVLRDLGFTLQGIEEMKFEDFSVYGDRFDFTPQYLCWMCLQVIQNSDKWEIDKLHRWVGDVSRGIRCLGLTTLDQEREKVRDAPNLPGAQEVVF